MYIIYSEEDGRGTKHELKGVTQGMAVCDRVGYSVRNDGAVYQWGFNYDNFIQKGD